MQPSAGCQCQNARAQPTDKGTPRTGPTLLHPLTICVGSWANGGAGLPGGGYPDLPGGGAAIMRSSGLGHSWRPAGEQLATSCPVAVNSKEIMAGERPNQRQGSNIVGRLHRVLHLPSGPTVDVNRGLRPTPKRSPGLHVDSSNSSNSNDNNHSNSVSEAAACDRTMPVSLGSTPCFELDTRVTVAGRPLLATVSAHLHREGTGPS